MVALSTSTLRQSFPHQQNNWCFCKVHNNNTSNQTVQPLVQTLSLLAVYRNVEPFASNSMPVELCVPKGGGRRRPSLRLCFVYLAVTVKHSTGSTIFCQCTTRRSKQSTPARISLRSVQRGTAGELQLAVGAADRKSRAMLLFRHANWIPLTRVRSSEVGKVNRLLDGVERCDVWIFTACCCWAAVATYAGKWHVSREVCLSRMFARFPIPILSISRVVKRAMRTMRVGGGHI